MPKSTRDFVDFTKVKRSVTIVQILEHYGLTSKLSQKSHYCSGRAPANRTCNPKISTSRQPTKEFKLQAILSGRILRFSDGIAECGVRIAKGQWVNTTIPDERFHRVKLKRGEKFLWYAEEQLARPVGSPANAAVMEKAARAKQAKEDWMKIQEMHRKK